MSECVLAYRINRMFDISLNAGAHRVLDLRPMLSNAGGVIFSASYR
jgi:hypothetical protein